MKKAASWIQPSKKIVAPAVELIIHFNNSLLSVSVFCKSKLSFLNFFSDTGLALFYSPQNRNWNFVMQQKTEHYLLDSKLQQLKFSNVIVYSPLFYGVCTEQFSCNKKQCVIKSLIRSFIRYILISCVLFWEFSKTNYRSFRFLFWKVLKSFHNVQFSIYFRKISVALRESKDNLRPLRILVLSNFSDIPLSKFVRAWRETVGAEIIIWLYYNFQIFK